ncbi:MAG: hypothetical protein BJ554DRAFT_6343 [Olpidium bornovanus]|uniref:Uncharacterized protein n=1 Tax=Olpidium bornovanus TaxID=278681 RepID=A0A8H7ZY05_9FUNG|nr:MAG: hypothetical protein BJ554DRAFT_6343 [Olpidium bornovanus]
MPPRVNKPTRKTMTDVICIALCQHKRTNPKLTHNQLIKWLEETEGMISNTLKQSDALCHGVPATVASNPSGCVKPLSGIACQAAVT